MVVDGPSKAHREVSRQPQLGNTPLTPGNSRPYTAQSIAALRNIGFKVEHPSSIQGRKLWRILNDHNDKGTYELTFGTTEPLIVKEMAKFSMSHPLYKVHLSRLTSSLSANSLCLWSTVRSVTGSLARRRSRRLSCGPRAVRGKTHLQHTTVSGSAANPASNEIL